MKKGEESLLGWCWSLSAINTGSKLVKMPVLNSPPPGVPPHPFPFLTIYGYSTCFKLQLKEFFCLKTMFILYSWGKKKKNP